MQESLFNTVCFIWLLIAVGASVAMFKVTAPFGRHTTEKWGPTVNNKLGWFIMELPSLAIMTWFLVTGSESMQSFVWILFALWIIHYFNRTVIYPIRIRPTPKRMPVIIILSAIFFNLVNAGLNGYYLSELATAGQYNLNWLTSWNFISGVALFLTGMYINIRSDNMLMRLRKPGETGYKIPKGFLFDYVSSPNLFGEIIQWTGFALMAWNLPAFTFMFWTMANLVPRAKNHHDWYVKQFPDYPAKRKIVFPFVF